MTETGVIVALCLFCAVIGIAFSETATEENRKKTEKTKIVCPEEEKNEEKISSESAENFFGEKDFALRNGYGVTRDKNPTFAEQWVNIMNYNGESQLEEDYEEESINSAEYLGRVS